MKFRILVWGPIISSLLSMNLGAQDASSTDMRVDTTAKNKKGEAVIRVHCVTRVNGMKGKKVAFECRLLKGGKPVSGASARFIIQIPYDRTLYKKDRYDLKKDPVIKALGPGGHTLTAQLVIQEAEGEKKTLGRTSVSFVLGKPEAASPSSSPLKVGQQVLARWNFTDDVHHYPAKVVSLRGGMVELKYADGSRNTIPETAVVARKIRKGDVVQTEKDSGWVIQVGPADRLTVERKKDGGKFHAKWSGVKVVLRTDHSLGKKSNATPFKEKEHVLAKWDPRSWYFGSVAAVRGEALLVQFNDGSSRWIPADHAIRPKVRPGDVVMGINKADGQPIPGILQKRAGKNLVLKLFDGSVKQEPPGRVLLYHDQVGIDFHCPCKKAPGSAENDPRVKARPLYAWLTPRIHYYYRERVPKGAAHHLDLVYVLHLPSDRKPPEKWRKILGVLGEQVKTFLHRELGPGMKIDVRIHPEPVKGTKDLAWYRKNLKPGGSWHDWLPISDSLRAAFPEGPEEGKHSVLILVPDAPGISDDKAKTEKGMSFVRMRGDYLEKMNLPSVLSISKGVAPTFADQWKEEYISSTTAHEVVHTLGVPHTDGDFWSVMNIGPWFPITRPGIHLSLLHKYVLRSPFTSSLSLSQGFAWYLMDARAGYFDVIRSTVRADSRLRLFYARGPGFFRLRETLKSFGPGTVCRQGQRTYFGDRVLCRAYLASWIHFLLERHGEDVLKKLFPASDRDAAETAAKLLGMTVDDLEAAWHDWLKSKGAGF